ncbi:MurR/RpiR family transcriptional regulator [Tropicimonas isoalkanivorans]|uniref:Transcriptional regulator, RpiR family n=1 Tax=Tropicimonas isoalkanivorans TaxID=441112 RepID=A0A1I1G973_9RHOB|nr:MurR/RpiR family transcriptional regulator [Tropicimonas isoalkanivorans]SFC08101.1 transcriptional regulator, RpiR family [Tropicimonas isoalkanivorans]
MPDMPAPQSIEAFHERLNEVSDTLPKRLKQCAEYFAVHSDRIALSTVSEVSAAAGVQPSALIRFCQILGFSGYSELQKLFRTSYAPTLPDYETRLQNLRERGAASPSAMLAEFVDAGRMSLEKITTTVDPRILDQAVAALAKANMIHIIGLKRSFPVSSYLAYAFDKMHIPAMLHDGVGKLSHRHAIREGDALIAITFAPYTEETLELASECTSRSVPVVAITDSASGPLHREGVLPIRVAEATFGAFRSLSATLSLALALAVAVGTARDDA